MSNIMVTNRCNLRCSYCFAGEQLGDAEMSLPAFTKALRFCLGGASTADKAPPPPLSVRGGYVGLIGGEPTLHSQFGELLLTAIKSDAQAITVFTNGTNLDQHRKLLTHRKVSLLVNFNDSETMGESLYNKMGEGILRLHANYHSDNIGLGLNIYKPQVLQLDDLLEMSKLLKIAKLRLSVSVPTSEYLKINSILEYFDWLKHTFIEVCMRFDEIGVAVSQDCNYIPRCVFTHSEVTALTALSRKYTEKLQTRVDYVNPAVCQPVIDILPDLKAVRCFGLSEALAPVDIAGFESLNELSGYFTVKLDNQLRCKTVSTACDSCRSLYVGCNMGCPRARVGLSA